jgi:hypothetical protein
LKEKGMNAKHPATRFSGHGRMYATRPFAGQRYFPWDCGAQGRIFTNNAQFTIPLFNSAYRKLQRKLQPKARHFQSRITSNS